LKKGRRRRQSLTGPSVPHRLPGSAPPKESPEIHRNIFKKVTIFRAQKTTTLITTKKHQLTTFSPQKTIHKTHKKRATPCKNAESPTLK
jgi:hypothetical protein